MDSAVTVDSIRQEYEHIASQQCECGGTYARKSQALMFDEQQTPYDRVSVQCSQCGAQREFWFNCSRFFGKPPKFD